MRYVVGAVTDYPPGSSTIVYPETVKSGIGVFNVGGEFYALKNTCPHMGGPLCRGRVRGTTKADTSEASRVGMIWVREGEIITCPWHHWEFDIKTGRTLFTSLKSARRYPVTIEPQEMRERLEKGVETVPVSVEDAQVVLHI